MNFLSIVQLLGGVGIFLYSITLISNSLQRAAGDKLRNLVGLLTRTPVLGVIVGTAVTCLIQSSSATTVMAVSFVDAGLMTLRQAIGTIMGANIGTTVTGQILAFRIKDFALLFIIAGVILQFGFKQDRIRQVGTGLIGFGLLFVGMQTMEGSMHFLRSRQDIFLALGSNPLYGLAAGACLTLLVQSSSATVGLTIALGAQGLLPLEAAIPIVLGDNIGTTITAVLASIGCRRTARQACAAHVLFNVIGVCIFLPLMPLYLHLIEMTASTVGHQIANAHTLFNVCNTLLFLPMVGPFARLIERLIPDRPSGAKAAAAPLLDPKLIERTPTFAIGALRQTVAGMGYKAHEVMLATSEALFNGSAADSAKARERAAEIAAQNSAVEDFAARLAAKELSEDDAGELRTLLLQSRQLDRLGAIAEHADSSVLMADSAARSQAQSMFEDACAAVDMTLLSFPNAPASLTDIARQADTVREAEARLRAHILKTLCEHPETQKEALGLIDLVAAIEDVAYNAHQLAGVTRTNQRA